MVTTGFFAGTCTSAGPHRLQPLAQGRACRAVVPQAGPQQDPALSLSSCCSHPSGPECRSCQAVHMAQDCQPGLALDSVQAAVCPWARSGSFFLFLPRKSFWQHFQLSFAARYELGCKAKANTHAPCSWGELMSIYPTLMVLTASPPWLLGPMIPTSPFE